LEHREFGSGVASGRCDGPFGRVSICVICVICGYIFPVPASPYADEQKTYTEWENHGVWLTTTCQESSAFVPIPGELLRKPVSKGTGRVTLVPVGG